MMAKAKRKRFPLPKRFNVSLSEKAYANLRGLNEKWLLGNNYLLVVLLENLEEIVDAEAFDRVFEDFIREYGAPGGEAASEVGAEGKKT